MSISKNTPKTGTLVASLGALTSSYVTTGPAADSGVLRCSGYDQIVLLIRWTKGDETSLEWKVQFSDTLAFTNAYEMIVTETAASGVSTVVPNSFTRASASTNMMVMVNVAMPFFRVQFKATAGTPTGTIGADYRLDNNER